MERRQNQDDEEDEEMGEDELSEQEGQEESEEDMEDEIPENEDAIEKDLQIPEQSSEVVKQFTPVKARKEGEKYRSATNPSLSDQKPRNNFTTKVMFKDEALKLYPDSPEMKNQTNDRD